MSPTRTKLAEASARMRRGLSFCIAGRLRRHSSVESESTNRILSCTIFPNGATHRLNQRHVTPGEVAEEQPGLPYSNR